QPRHGVRRLGAALQPMIDSLVIETHLWRLRNWIIVTNHLHGTAIARALPFDHYDAVRGLFLGAKPRQSNY
ncbi:MAG TPA: hypothetical protein VN579_03625, partial [Bryobacteraceae bacterium]|nr:hypothetical protein [Bryobacteraceae bacterium]